MVRHYSLLLLAAGALLGIAWSLQIPDSVGDDKAPAAKEEPAKKPTNKKLAMKAFMRKKLEASQSILEGLAMEDFDLIARGAKQLKATSTAAEFLVIHDPLYAENADEFRRIIDKMEKAAKEKRIDGATLAYMDMTMSCVECHKYVRNVLIAN